MRNRRGLLGLASLLFCLWGAADAQSPGGGSNTPQPQMRVRDLPPEIRAQLPPDLSPDTLLSGPPRTDGRRRPCRSFRSAGPGAAALGRGRGRCGSGRRIDAAPAGPFPTRRSIRCRSAVQRAPSGGHRYRATGRGGRNQTLRAPEGAFTPADDENGEIYPGICLQDRRRRWSLRNRAFPALSGPVPAAVDRDRAGPARSQILRA